MIILRSRPCEPCVHDPSKPLKKFMTTMEVIIKACEHFGISVQRLMMKDKKREIVVPRHYIMTYLLNESYENLTSAGQVLSLDRATVRHGVKQTNRWRAVYSDVRKQYEDMVAAINE